MARVVLNDGLAAVVWLGFGTVVTTPIRSLALRGQAEAGRLSDHSLLRQTEFDQREMVVDHIGM